MAAEVNSSRTRCLGPWLRAADESSVHVFRTLRTVTGPHARGLMSVKLTHFCPDSSSSLAARLTETVSMVFDQRSLRDLE